mgnify:CR=1 FL=1
MNDDITTSNNKSHSNFLLEVIDLTISVKQGDQWHDLVHEISFQLCAGQTLGIVGESGCGKSLTVQAIMRLLPQPDMKIRSGQILFNGKDLLKLSQRQLNEIRGNKIAMIFQEPMTALNPVRTIGSQIREQIQLHQNQLTSKETHRLCLQLLMDVGLDLVEKREKNYPHQLSGGMRQRVMIAMALSCKPELIIADEPTTALDVNIQAQILALLQSLQKKYQTSLLFISHDLAVIAQICEQALVMYGGKIIERASIQQLFNQPQHPYSQALILCSPSRNHPCRQPLPCIPQAQTENEPEQQQIERFQGVLDEYQRTEKDFSLIENKAQTETVLQLKDIFKSFELNSSIFNFRKHPFYAVKNASLKLQKGKTLGIVGTSGSGKTTLAKMIAGFLTPDSGDILYQGKPLDRSNRLILAKELQYIFQDPQESLNSRHTIQQLLIEPLIIHGIGTAADRIDKAKEMLALVGLPDHVLSRYPHEFSGGQKQRIGIARGLILQPKLLICDEPVSALDVSVQAQILNLLVELQQKLNLTMIFITHDLAVVRHIADDIAVMHDGEIIEYGAAVRICDQPQENYTQQLIASTPTWPISDNRLA